MSTDLHALTTSIVVAMASNNNLTIDEVPELITSTYNSLAKLRRPTEIKDERPEPAVSIRASVKPDYIVCLEDGKKFKMLKRHLAVAYNMTPDEYRERWELPSNYPMTAPNYTNRRSEMAKQIGLGRKSKEG